MRLLEQMEAAATAAGCENEIRALDSVIAGLSARKTAGIAIIGEEKCGKTTLVNKLAGQEVRKASMMPLEEPPLMVVFGSGEGEPGYELARLEVGEADAGISIYELPLHMAIDQKTGEILPMLEEMDIVIYLVSAVMPLTGTDLVNIGSVADRFPLLIYISKMDLIEEEAERRACADYVRKGIQEQFGGAVGEVFESLDPVGDIKERFQGISLEDIRRFHIMRLEGQAKAAVAKNIKQKLEQLDDQQRERVAKLEQKNEQYRSRQLEWDGFRVAMREREQAAKAAADQNIAAAKRETEKRLAAQLDQAKEKAEWINHRLKASLGQEMDAALADVLTDVGAKAQADAAWLASEVNRKLGVQITMDVADVQLSPQGGQDTGVSAQKPGYRKLAVAFGTGLLAGGAVFSSMALLPTSLVAIPASLASYCFLKESSHDREAYNKELHRKLKKCCESHFTQMAEEVHGFIGRYYGRMTEDIHRFGVLRIAEDDFADISQKREELCGILESLYAQG